MKQKIEHLCVGPLATNTYIVPLSPEGFRKKHCMLVDPGGDAPEIIARIEALRLRVSLIVLTHGHFDHLLALAAVLEHFRHTGEDIPIAIHASEAARTGPTAEALHRNDFLRIGALDFFETYSTPIPSATRLLNDGDRLYAFEVLHVPGHSPGSIALYDSGRALLFSGDTLFRSGVGRTDLPGGDPLALQRSLKRLLALPPSTTVLPGHGKISSIGREAEFLGF